MCVCVCVCVCVFLCVLVHFSHVWISSLPLLGCYFLSSASTTINTHFLSSYLTSCPHASLPVITPHFLSSCFTSCSLPKLLPSYFTSCPHTSLPVIMLHFLFTIPQVQLLVSERDVHNYRLIKDNLDVLRMLVEEAELWVKRRESVVDTTATRKTVS